MDQDLITKIEERKSELIKEREQFLKEANERLSAYNGAIGELERLLAPPKEELK